MSEVGKPILAKKKGSPSPLFKSSQNTEGYSESQYHQVPGANARVSQGALCRESVHRRHSREVTVLGKAFVHSLRKKKIHRKVGNGNLNWMASGRKKYFCKKEPLPGPFQKVFVGYTKEKKKTRPGGDG